MLKTTFNRIVFCLICFLAFQYSGYSQAICTATVNGAWNDPATWSCGNVPACGDSVIIPAALTVTVTVQQDYAGCASGPNIVIYGVLKFDNGNKLKLPCDARIYIMPGGSIQPGTGGGNSNYIEICNDIVWNAGSGNLTGPSCLPSNSAFCNSVVLPVEIVSFTGDAKDGFVDLNWITATERNSSHFEIERSSDASAFEKTGTVNSKALNGNSNAAISYNAIDNLPVGKVIYYRLKQVDINNSFEYSGIISVNYIKAKNLRFIVYPNPNKGEFTADISGLENNHEISISIKDSNGKVMYNSSFFIQDQGSKLNIIPETKLPNGIYICTLTLEGIEYNVKVVVS